MAFRAVALNCAKRGGNPGVLITLGRLVDRKGLLVVDACRGSLRLIVHIGSGYHRLVAPLAGYPQVGEL